MIEVVIALVTGELVTSSHPVGWVQIRVRRRLRPARLTAVASALLALIALEPRAALAALALAAMDMGRGAWRTGPAVRRRIRQLAQ